MRNWRAFSSDLSSEVQKEKISPDNYHQKYRKKKSRKVQDLNDHTKRTNAVKCKENFGFCQNGSCKTQHNEVDENNIQRKYTYLGSIPAKDNISSSFCISRKSTGRSLQCSPSTSPFSEQIQDKILIITVNSMTTDLLLSQNKNYNSTSIISHKLNKVRTQNKYQLK